MRYRGWQGHIIARGSILGLSFVCLCLLFVSPIVHAETSSSSENYQMVEGEFGIGSTDNDSCSDQYCSDVISVGDADEIISKTTASFDTEAYTEPILQMIVSAESSNLGVLTTEKTATKTMSIQIRNYLSGGYTLQIIGDTPKYNGYNLEALSIAEASQPGVEQFGINVVANTTPDVGKNPIQSTTDGNVYGEAAEGYNESNKFKYKSGDVVAKSVQNSGGTDYTISIIVNISSSTPSGHYTGDFSAILVPAY